MASPRSSHSSSSLDLSYKSHPEYLNLLLIGPSEVGKTLWINSLHNYFKFSSFQEAQNKIQFLIPSQFTMMDSDFNEILVKCPASVQSSINNQSINNEQGKSYIIQYSHNKFLRLIDTPSPPSLQTGIQKDIRLFDHIQKYLQFSQNGYHPQEIHAILVFLKPNESQLDPNFESILKQLLACLPRDATSRLLFCYTNTRGNSYRPGETLKTLKTFFSPTPITLNKLNMYCFDSESIRFLAAKSQNLNFTPDQVTSSKLSWDVSASESRRLVEYLSTLHTPAILISKILKLSELQNLFYFLREPILDLCRVIQGNITQAEETTDGQLDNVMVVTMEFKILDQPKVICLSHSCPLAGGEPSTAEVDPDATTCPLYTNPCHLNCESTNFRARKIDKKDSDPNYVAAKHKLCTKCGCEEFKHFPLNVEPFMVKSEVSVESMEDLILVLERESDDVLRIGKTIQNLLKETSLTMYGDKLLEYLDLCQRLEDRDYPVVRSITERYQQVSPFKKKIYSATDLFKTMKRRCVHYRLMGQSVLSMMGAVRELVQESDDEVEKSMQVFGSIYMQQHQAVSTPSISVFSGPPSPKVEKSGHSSPQERPRQEKRLEVENGGLKPEFQSSLRSTIKIPVKAEKSVQLRSEFANEWKFDPRNKHKKDFTFQEPRTQEDREGWVHYKIYYPPEPRRRKRQECFLQ